MNGRKRWRIRRTARIFARATSGILIERVLAGAGSVGGGAYPHRRHPAQGLAWRGTGGVSLEQRSGEYDRAGPDPDAWHDDAPNADGRTLADMHRAQQKASCSNGM